MDSGFLLFGQRVEAVVSLNGQNISNLAEVAVIERESDCLLTFGGENNFVAVEGVLQLVGRPAHRTRSGLHGEGPCSEEQKHEPEHEEDGEDEALR